MRQWMFKITAYADRLLEDLDDLDWPESIKEMQRNWIGRSEGAELEFCVLDNEGQETDLRLTVYTTRPDTIFGATYLVVAPEYYLLSSFVSAPQSEFVEEYKDIASRKSELERTERQKEKTGVFSGCYTRNPATGEAIPVWVADYVSSKVFLHIYHFHRKRTRALKVGLICGGPSAEREISLNSARSVLDHIHV